MDRERERERGEVRIVWRKIILYDSPGTGQKGRDCLLATQLYTTPLA